VPSHVVSTSWSARREAARSAPTTREHQLNRRRWPPESSPTRADSSSTSRSSSWAGVTSRPSTSLAAGQLPSTSASGHGQCGQLIASDRARQLDRLAVLDGGVRAAPCRRSTRASGLPARWRRRCRCAPGRSAIRRPQHGGHRMRPTRRQVDDDLAQPGGGQLANSTVCAGAVGDQLVGGIDANSAGGPRRGPTQPCQLFAHQFALGLRGGATSRSTRNTYARSRLRTFDDPRALPGGVGDSSRTSGRASPQQPTGMRGQRCSVCGPVMP